MATKLKPSPSFPVFLFFLFFFFLGEGGGFIVQQEYLFDCQWEGTFLTTRMSGLAQGSCSKQAWDLVLQVTLGV